MFSDRSKDIAGTLTLNKDSITSDDKTVQIDKTTATITKAGTYILTGTLTDGQIIVDAENKGDVKLVLNDAVINCSSSAPIYIKSGNTVITLADGTENSVSDGEEYIYEKEDDDEPNAAIFAKDDLTFNGSGSLTVTGNYNHAIRSKDDLKFVAGTFDILTNGTGQNMTQNSDSAKALKSYVELTVAGGKFTINSCDDALHSNQNVTIENGTFTITSSDDGSNPTGGNDDPAGRDNGMTRAHL